LLSLKYFGLLGWQLSQRHDRNWPAAAGLCGAGALLLAGFALHYYRRRPRSHRRYRQAGQHDGHGDPPGRAEFAGRAAVNLLATVPLVESLGLIGLTATFGQTAVLMLTIVAIGAGVRDEVSAASLIVVAVIAWSVLAYTRGDAATEDQHVGAYAVRMGSAVVVAVVMFVMRRHRQAALERVIDATDGQVRALASAKAALESSEARYQYLFRESPVGVALLDDDGRYATVNAAFCELLGRDEDELVGHADQEFTHPEDCDDMHRLHCHGPNADNGVVNIEKRYLRPDGQVRWAWLALTRPPEHAADQWLLAQAQDVTARKSAEQSLIDSEANLTAVSAVIRRIQSGEDARETIVLSTAGIAGAAHTCILEPDGLGSLVATAASEPFMMQARVELTAVSATVRAFTTGEPLFIADPAGHPLISAEMLAITRAKSVFCAPVTFGETVTGVLVVTWNTPVLDIDDRCVKAIMLLAAETGVALHHAGLLSELEKRATTDGLTGLLNRRGWDSDMRRLSQLARRHRCPLTVALADLDHFKLYNDSNGHHAGDVLLQEFALAARATLRSVDLLARWGGEEFAIALADCDADAAVAVLDKVRRSVPDGQTCSIGFARWDGEESLEQLMCRADAALYRAKEAGRDLVRGSDDSGGPQRRLAAFG